MAAITIWPMNNAVPTHEPFDIAIIGGGAGGTLAAIHALRNARAGQRIALIEANAALGEGAAYSTRQKEHVLNVPVRGMSAFADQPQDFLDYTQQHDSDGASRDELAPRFAQRRRYADYLRTRLLQAQRASAGKLLTVNARAIALDGFDGAARRIELASGYALHARGIVLASGNHPRALPLAGGESLAREQHLGAWDYRAIGRIAPDACVAIVGTGLSMVDSAQTLAAQGHRGRIHVLSRHGLPPLAHADDARAHEFDVPPLLALNLRQRMHRIRELVREAHAAGLPWQSVFERLRPHGQAQWQSLAHADQQRFLRHVVRYWDIHRHRIAPQVRKQLHELQRLGRLQLHRVRIDRVDTHEGRVRIGVHDHAGANASLDVDVIVNATGVELDVARQHNPLLAQLLQSGHARRGPHGLGLDTSVNGELLDADGTPQPRLRAIGSLRIGTLWESLAVPELRVQAEAAAKALLE